MSQSSNLAQRLMNALDSKAQERELELVDVEIVGSSKLPCVRIRIDHADHERETISLDEVAEQTRWISEALDELDPFAGSFTLEVSSPGLDRPLHRPADFERFAGQTVSLTTIEPLEGRSRWTALLRGFNTEKASISLELETGEIVEIAYELLKKCNIKPNYDATKGVKK